MLGTSRAMSLNLSCPNVAFKGCPVGQDIGAKGHQRNASLTQVHDTKPVWAQSGSSCPTYVSGL